MDDNGITGIPAMGFVRLAPIGLQIEKAKMKWKHAMENAGFITPYPSQYTFTLPCHRLPTEHHHEPTLLPDPKRPAQTPLCRIRLRPATQSICSHGLSRPHTFTGYKFVHQSQGTPSCMGNHRSREPRIIKTPELRSGFSDGRVRKWPTQSAR